MILGTWQHGYQDVLASIVHGLAVQLLEQYKIKLPEMHTVDRHENCSIQDGTWITD